MNDEAKGHWTHLLQWMRDQGHAELAVALAYATPHWHQDVLTLTYSTAHLSEMQSAQRLVHELVEALCDYYAAGLDLKVRFSIRTKTLADRDDWLENTVAADLRPVPSLKPVSSAKLLPASHSCHACGQAIAQGKGRLSVDYKYAFAVRAAHEVKDAEEVLQRQRDREAGVLRPVDFGAYFKAVDESELWTEKIPWYPEHDGCDVFDDRSAYSISLKRLSSWADLWRTTSHLATTKNWFQYSDWFEYWRSAMRVAEVEAAPPEPEVDHPHTLYRAFGADGRLLYVGISKNFKKRKQQHAARSQWYSLAVEWHEELYPNRKAALAAEATAILEERPIFNRAQVGA